MLLKSARRSTGGPGSKRYLYKPESRSPVQQGTYSFRSYHRFFADNRVQNGHPVFKISVVKGYAVIIRNQVFVIGNTLQAIDNQHSRDQEITSDHRIGSE